MERGDLLERLQNLDEEASLLLGETERLHMIIVGGGALVLLECIARSTHDIDVLEVSNQIQEMLWQYDMNTRVKTYINNFPYNYEDRIQPVFRGRLIDFYTASLEDIVVAKLYSYRDTDREDLTAPGVLAQLDWERLRYLATAEEEAKINALNERLYREFLDRYLDYEREYRPCET